MGVCGAAGVSLTSRLSAETQCKTTAKADIVLLVDGSWSIGRINFKTIRNFISRMVSVFEISPDRVQIGNIFTFIIVHTTTITTAAPPVLSVTIMINESYYNNSAP